MFAATLSSIVSPLDSVPLACRTTSCLISRCPLCSPVLGWPETGRMPGEFGMDPASSHLPCGQRIPQTAAPLTQAAVAPADSMSSLSLVEKTDALEITSGCTYAQFQKCTGCEPVCMGCAWRWGGRKNVLRVIETHREPASWHQNKVQKRKGKHG